jgi:putative ribosome biogenesis GTPase RsgA
MFIGQTGTGKSSAINLLGNYILGVNLESDVRYECLEVKN